MVMGGIGSWGLAPVIDVGEGTATRRVSSMGSTDVIRAIERQSMRCAVLGMYSPKLHFGHLDREL